MWSRVPTRMELEIRESGTVRASVMSTDHGCGDRHRLHFGPFGGHVLELPGNQPGEAQETFRGGFPCRGIRARQFTPPGGKDATGRPLGLGIARTVFPPTRATASSRLP